MTNVYRTWWATMKFLDTRIWDKPMGNWLIAVETRTTATWEFHVQRMRLLPHVWNQSSNILYFQLHKENMKTMPHMPACFLLETRNSKSQSSWKQWRCEVQFANSGASPRVVQTMIGLCQSDTHLYSNIPKLVEWNPLNGTRFKMA